MNSTLIKAAIAAGPVSLLFFYSALAFLREKTLGSFLQLVGAASLAVVILSHVCEALQLLSSMGWGAEHSAGHYLDLSSAIVGLTWLPLGYLLQRLARKRCKRSLFC